MEDAFFNVSEDLIPAPEIKPAQNAVIDLDGLLQKPLKLHENLKEGCGGQLWPAGVVLAKYCLRHPDKLQGRTIVELGAGGGLVGLAVARGCSDFHKPLYITDQQQMLALMQRNITSNDLHDAVTPAVYNWGEARPANIPRHPDVILAADCVYFEPTFPLLLSTLKDLIGEATVCLFCQKKRRRADMQFIKTAKKMFDVREITDDADRDSYGRDNIFLYEIRMKADR